VHDDVNLLYAFFYSGVFSSAQHFDALGSSWRDWGSIHPNNVNRTFGFERQSSDFKSLYINGSKYPLKDGRVFVLHKDGTVEQLLLRPSLATARDVDLMAKIVEDPDAEYYAEAAVKIRDRLQHAVATHWGNQNGTLPRQAQLSSEWENLLSKADVRGAWAEDETLKPYLKPAVVNPFTGKARLAAHGHATVDAGWSYDEATHTIRLVAPAGQFLASFPEDQVERVAVTGDGAETLPAEQP